MKDAIKRNRNLSRNPKEKSYQFSKFEIIEKMKLGINRSAYIFRYEIIGSSKLSDWPSG